MAKYTKSTVQTSTEEGIEGAWKSFGNRRYQMRIEFKRC